MGIEVLLNRMLEVQARTTAIRDTRKAKNNPSAWRKVWDDEVKKYFPECKVTYSDFTSRRIRLAIENRGLPIEDMPRFIPWAVKNWESLRRNAFSLNPKKPYGPMFPAMDTLLHFLDKVYPIYFREQNALTYIRPTVSTDALPPTAVPPQPVKKQVPAFVSAPPRPKLPEYDHAKTEAIRIKNGWPKWE